MRVETSGEPEPIELARPAELADFYVLSPYVIPVSGGYEMLVRLVNRDDDPKKKVSRVYHAASGDGTHFTLGARAISPGNVGEPDDGGCEDPTIVSVDGAYDVFYSGYECARKRSQLLRAGGPSLDGLSKAGQLLPDDTYANPKEAAVVATSDGYRLFFEYASEGASRIGVADAPAIAGPWTYGECTIEPREGCFDSWHLSPSSAVKRDDGSVVLFYNGSTRKADWRVSWALLDESATSIVDRATNPLIAPFDLEEGDSDIAFAASSVVVAADTVALYYSISDRRLYRSLVRIDGAVAGATDAP